VTIELFRPYLEGSQVSFVVAAGEFFKAENPIHQEQTEVEEDCPKVVFPSLLKVQLGEAKK
jgi:hypothetical protein